MKLGSGLDLKGEIGGGSREEPFGAIDAKRELRLGARLGDERLAVLVLAYIHTIPTAAIPLREPTPGR